VFGISRAGGLSGIKRAMPVAFSITSRILNETDSKKYDSLISKVMSNVVCTPESARASVFRDTIAYE
jgi:hypothetical protein